MKRKSRLSNQDKINQKDKVLQKSGLSFVLSNENEPNKDLKKASNTVKDRKSKKEKKITLHHKTKEHVKLNQLKNKLTDSVRDSGDMIDIIESETSQKNKETIGQSANHKQKDGILSLDNIEMSQNGNDLSLDESAICSDPYLLNESNLCKDAMNDNKWTNKQRTLVFSSRGVSHRQRHFMEDLKRMFPHVKSEPKWEKNSTLSEINEICEMQSCNNCLYFETRKGSELYMWMARTPNGPSVRFQVLNIHTLGELKMTGNCLLHSRPLLIFDKSFQQRTELRLLQEMFIQTFGTPRNHPKAKPFFDHVFSFMYHDSKIWFRHYQVSPMTEKDNNKPDRQLLTEIGPRFVLDPIKIFDGSFGGSTIYENPHYLTPTAIRNLASRGIGSKYAARKAAEHQHKLLLESLKLGKDMLDPSNIFETKGTNQSTVAN